MYVIDLTHFLDAKGAIAPARGPARKMADFLTAVGAHASDFGRSADAPGPVCFMPARILRAATFDRFPPDTGARLMDGREIPFDEGVVRYGCPAVAPPVGTAAGKRPGVAVCRVLGPGNAG